jgi:hypothetical protein
MIRTLVLIFFLISCSSNDRSKYQRYSKKNGGYKEQTLGNDLRIVSFHANSYTKKKLAATFARFRAIEICLAENFKLAHLLDSFDRTQSKTITRSSSSGYPSYYYGMSPFWNRYHGFGYGFGWSTQTGSSWNETIQYPEVEVIYECANDVYEPQVKLREVSAEEMKHLVKDLRGGLQIEALLSDSPDKKQLRVGDIILRGNGERVQELYQLLALFRRSKGHKIDIEIMRDGKLKTGLTLTGVDASEKMLKAQQDIIKSACKNKEIKEKKLCK